MQKQSPTAPVLISASPPDAACMQATRVASRMVAQGEPRSAPPMQPAIREPLTAPEPATPAQDTYTRLCALAIRGMETMREAGVLLVRCQTSTLALVGPALRAPRDIRYAWLSGRTAHEYLDLPLVRALMRRADSERVLNAATPIARIVSWGIWTAMQGSEYRNSPEVYASGCAALAAAHLGCDALHIQGEMRDLIFMCTYTIARETTHAMLSPTLPAIAPGS